MGLIDKIRFHYNYRVRPRFDKDLKSLFQIAEKDYPFEVLPDTDHIQLALDWWSVTHNALDGKGFPTKFNVLHNYGLGPSYPETTGYTLNTLLTLLRNRPFEFDEDRVATMTRNSYDWLASIQFENGAWTGGHAALHNYGKPSVFNTGQILLGMIDVYQSLRDGTVKHSQFEGIDLEDLEDRCRRAAYFLKDQLQPDGTFATQFAYTDQPLTYYCRSMYGALNTGIVLEDEQLLEAIRPHYDWVASMQDPSGWINQWGFEEDWAVMHRISYTLRGMVEAALHYQDEKYFQVVCKGIDFLINVDRSGFRYTANMLSWEDGDQAPSENDLESPEGQAPSKNTTMNSEGKPNPEGHTNPTKGNEEANPIEGLIPSYISRDGKFRNELCLTGLSQLAIVLAKLPDEYRNPQCDALLRNILSQTKYFQTRGFKNPFMNGALPGSYPLSGKYKSYDLLEWATKFFVDTMLIKMGVLATEIKG